MWCVRVKNVNEANVKMVFLDTDGELGNFMVNYDKTKYKVVDVFFNDEETVGEIKEFLPETNLELGGK